jgi:hypothetical protein
VTLVVLAAPLLADGNSFPLSGRSLGSVQAIGCGTDTVHVSVLDVVIVRIARGVVNHLELVTVS